MENFSEVEENFLSSGSLQLSSVENNIPIEDIPK